MKDYGKSLGNAGASFKVKSHRFQYFEPFQLVSDHLGLATVAVEVTILLFWYV